jgi:hypothetical protein
MSQDFDPAPGLTLTLESVLSPLGFTTEDVEEEEDEDGEAPRNLLLVLLRALRSASPGGSPSEGR